MNLLKKYWLLVLFFLIAIFLILFPYRSLDGWSIYGYELHTWHYNELGDFIGGITAPFLSFVAILLLYLTYVSQKEELRLTRELMVKQTDTLNKQQFETTFFSLLKVHNDNLNDISVKDFSKATFFDQGDYENLPIENGRRSFYVLYLILKKSYERKEGVDGIEKIKAVYNDFFVDNQSNLGHYFRTLYHVVKFIDDSEMEDKKNYISIVKAQISTYELLLLFYNGLSDRGGKFKGLIEKYTMLENLPLDKLFGTVHNLEYDHNAYKKVVL